MTFQTLAAFLISWVVPGDTQAKTEGFTGEDLPRWERHPAEQRRLRESDHRATDLWSQIPRSW